VLIFIREAWWPVLLVLLTVNRAREYIKHTHTHTHTHLTSVLISLPIYIIKNHDFTPTYPIVIYQRTLSSLS
jgi:hypothetical protein